MSEEKYARSNFIFYGSIRDATKDIDDPMIRLEIYEAVIDYSLYETEPADISAMAMIVFKLLRPTLDAQRASCENGKKGGLMKKKKPPSENSESPLSEKQKAPLQKSKKPPSENSESYKDKDKDKDKDMEKDEDKEINNARARDYLLTLQPDVKNSISLILSYFAEKTGKKYRQPTEKLCKQICYWLDKGYDLSDFTRVIDHMCEAWKNTKYEVGLRPSKLFGDDFEQYLGWYTPKDASSTNMVYDVNDLEQYILQNTVKADD